MDDAQKKILNAAFALALEHGYQWITRDSVAEAAGVSTGYVNWKFGKFVEVKRAVVRLAIERGNLKILAEALADQSPIAQAAPLALKQQAIASLT